MILVKKTFQFSLNPFVLHSLTSVCHSLTHYKYVSVQKVTLVLLSICTTDSSTMLLRYVTTSLPLYGDVGVDWGEADKSVDSLLMLSLSKVSSDSRPLSNSWPLTYSLSMLFDKWLLLPVVSHTVVWLINLDGGLMRLSPRGGGGGAAEVPPLINSFLFTASREGTGGFTAETRLSTLREDDISRRRVEGDTSPRRCDGDTAVKWTTWPFLRISLLLLSQLALDDWLTIWLDKGALLILWLAGWRLVGWPIKWLDCRLMLSWQFCCRNWSISFCCRCIVVSCE